MAISVLTNASDGLAWFWLDGMLHVARALAQKGKPTEDVLGWTGRWWNAWGAFDLLPAGNRVLIAAPASIPSWTPPKSRSPSPNEGRVALAAGYGWSRRARSSRARRNRQTHRVVNSGRPLRSRGRGREGNARPLRPSGQFLTARRKVVVVAKAIPVVNRIVALVVSRASRKATRACVLSAQLSPPRPRFG